MSRTRIEFPYPSVQDKDVDQAVGLGKIYIGLADFDPEVPANQLQLKVINQNGSVSLLTQPLALSASGVPLHNGSPVQAIVEASRYSVKILDANDVQVYYNSRHVSSLTQDTLELWTGDFKINADDKDAFIISDQLGVGFDPASLSYTGKSTAVVPPASTNDIGNPYLHPDGTKLYIIDDRNQEVFEYTLSIPNDISTKGASATDSVVLSAGSPNFVKRIWFENNGSKLIAWKQTAIDEYNLTTPYDISTAVHVQTASPFPTDTIDVTPSENGEHLYATRHASATTILFIDEYDVGTVGDVSTISKIRELDVSAYADQKNSQANTCWIATGGSKLLLGTYESTSTGFAVRAFDLPTPYDISTAGTPGPEYVLTEPSQAKPWYWNAEGTIMIQLDDASGSEVFRQYDSTVTDPNAGVSVISYHDGVEKMRTQTYGILISGEIQATAFRGAIVPNSYTTAALPATATAGTMAFCTDIGAAGAPVYWDGSNWRKMSDDSIVA